MVPSSLFWKLFTVYAALNITLAAVFLYLAANNQRVGVLSQVRHKLHDIAVLLRTRAEEELASPHAQAQPRLQATLRRLAPELDVRLTLLAPDGAVLADSQIEPSGTENHRDRPEVVEARGPQRQGWALRASEHTGVQMLYHALPVSGPQGLLGVVRVAADMQSIDGQIAGAQQQLLWLAIVVGAAAVGLTYLFVGQLLAPVGELTAGAEALLAGNYEHRVTYFAEDELGLLASAFRKMQHDLARRFRSMEEANERLTTVLASMDEGVIAVDADQRILLANSASRRLLDFVTSDVVARPLLEVTRSLPVHDAIVQALGQSESVQAEFEAATTPRRALLLTANRFPGAPTPGVVVVLRDVTELRRLEGLRREFVTNVSHELKTPLASIQAYAETLRLGALHDEEHNVKFVARIEEQAARLHQLIIDLLHLARVETGQESFEIEDVPVAEVVARCVRDYRDAAESNQIALASRPSQHPLAVKADEEALYTILSNLVDNAIKYTPAGGRVELSWRLEGTLVQIDVSDTGIGIPQDHQPRVFERFYRVDKARSRELGGTGLGLSIVKHLAQAFGGNVGLTSSAGAGATFHVRLPLSS